MIFDLFVENQIMENPILDYNLDADEEIIEPRYAGFWTRVVASILDALIMLPIAIFSFFTLIYLKSLPLYILAIIISGAYKPFCEYKFGATLGKMAIDLKVVNENFQRISLDQSIIRSSLFLISSVTSIIFILLIDSSKINELGGFFEIAAMSEESNYSWLNNLGSWPVLISCIVVAFTAKKQGFHDMMAKTYCVHKD